MANIYAILSDVADILARERNAEYLQVTWSSWQEHLNDSGEEFSSVLQLVNEAAELNGKYLPEINHYNNI